jgi:hypothetical protein
MSAPRRTWSAPSPRLLVAALLVVPLVLASAGRAPGGEDAHDGHAGLLADRTNRFTRVVPDPDALWLQSILATILVDYVGFEAFPDAQAAFQHAVNIWAATISSPVPIRVRAEFATLPPNVLGSAGARWSVRDFANAPAPNTWYPIALANKLAGFDLLPAEYDVTATFASNLTEWYFGTDGYPPANRFDFVTVVLHELGHGLGFAGSMRVQTGIGSWGHETPFPSIYDRFTVNGSGQALLNTALFPNYSTTLAAQLQSNNLFWSSAGTAASPPRIYAPGSWAQGSSYSHLNEATYPPGNVNSLMTPFLGFAEAIHVPGPLTTAIFTDMGWELACTYTLTPASAAFLSTGGTGTVTVTTQPGCLWTAGSNSPAFLTVTGGSTGTGSGTVSYSVAAHTGADRTGALTIAGQTFSVLQYAPCGYALVPASGVLYHPAGGRSGEIQVVTQPLCAWAASSEAIHVTVTSGTSGVGSGTVRYWVEPNGGPTSRTGTLTVAGHSVTVVQSAVPPRRTPLDFDGDGVSDFGVFRPSNGVWYVSGRFTLHFGTAGDIPVPGDYSGDGMAQAAVFRPSTGLWYIPGAPAVAWGGPGDIPVPADYDGDGATDIAVFTPATGVWRIRNVGTVTWGRAGDTPVPGDYNGDGIADIAVFRMEYVSGARLGTWDIRNQGIVRWGSPGDIPVPADYDADGGTDFAVFRPSTGVWYVKDLFSQAWGTLGDVPVPLDRSGDGRAELGVFRPSSGTWYFYNRLTGGPPESVWWGAARDVPLGAAPRHRRQGDVDGDGKSDLVIFRPSSAQWFLRHSITNGAVHRTLTLGGPSVVPVARDYDGDGLTDPSVFRLSDGSWRLLESSTGYSTVTSRVWGAAGDVPVPGDYDGDGLADLAVFRPSDGHWYVLLSSSRYTASLPPISWGLPTDIPVPGDYDGDGRTDIAVFRPVFPSKGIWYIRYSSTDYATWSATEWGVDTDVPVAADYDGDGKTDLAVFRRATGQWFIVSSATRTSLPAVTWGIGTDVAVPADYDGDGKADIAVYRPSSGTWFVRNVLTATWGGVAGDVPATR